MRVNPIFRYLLEVVIATALYLLFVLFFYNYIVANFETYDAVGTALGYSIAQILYDNQVIFLIFGYILMLLIISARYIVRYSKLIVKAGRAIDDDTVLAAKCPAELREFNDRLKDFKLSLRETEHARALSEQQKSDLIVYLAHDLKTPLTSVIGYLSLLDEAPDMPPEQRAKFTGIALDKAYRLEQLINEFFDITRLNLQTIEPQKANTNLTILLMQITGEFYPMLEEKRLTLKTDIDSELTLMADSDKLARVFDNIFRNAVSYCHEGTEITCSAHRSPEGITVKISNHGDDISPEKLERIFDKFYRADSARQSSSGGAGLGLAIAKQIVELHGGTIGASCRDGVIEFCVTLPT